jgi:hypothetical protein
MSNPKYRVLDIESMGAEKKKLWKRESRYWDLFCQGDRGCLEMVSEAFLGWPHNADTPQDKTGIGKVIANYRQNPSTPILEPVGISIIDNTAIVHLIRILSIPASGTTRLSARVRVIHTWLNQNGEWMLLGGMGYPEGQ